MWLLRCIVVTAVLLTLTGCSVFRDSSSGAYFEDDGPPNSSPDPSTVADAVPRAEPLSTIGNSPYQVFGIRYVPMSSVMVGYSETGEASWYGRKFHGRTTANGDEYDMFAMTAAHKTLPLPSYLRVRNLRNDQEVVVRVNDRGPFLGGRILDLSYMAAKKLGIVMSGTAPVDIQVVGTATGRQMSSARSVRGERQQRVFLQAGSFRLQDNAERLKAKLIRAGIPDIRIVTVEYKENRYYRVQAGPVSGTSAIRTQRAIIMEITGLKPTAVRE
ncbi:MAG TPA: septal ring lytic transglycosylase RlpA family lipoprotein [Gammaproteobacteria bacterium]|nr:septal ring lytic transglycosylase RlpA family lipoprotein [Gammaproteobacteria bacterium]